MSVAKRSMSHLEVEGQTLSLLHVRALTFAWIDFEMNFQTGSSREDRLSR